MGLIKLQKELPESGRSKVKIEGNDVTTNCDLMSTVEFDENETFLDKYYLETQSGCVDFEFGRTFTIENGILTLDFANPDSKSLMTPFVWKKTHSYISLLKAENTFTFTRTN